MTIILPNADNQQVTLTAGKAYDVTYYWDPDTTTSKKTEQLLFLGIKETVVGDENTVGLRFIDITKNNSDYAEQFRAICAKDILRIVERPIADTVIEGLTWSNVGGIVKNPLSLATASNVVYKYS